MDDITLFGTIAIVVMGMLAKRLLRLWLPEGPQSSTYHKVLAVHIADTTRSAGRNL